MMRYLAPLPKTVMLALLIVCAALRSAAAQAPRAAGGFELDADTPWVVAPGQPESVARALDDVKADWYKVLGHVPAILAEPPKDWHGPVVYLGLTGAWLKELLPEPFAGPESFVLTARRGAAGGPALVATGADARGAIYAAYALSEELLGVDPWYFWTDHEPQARKSVAIAAGFEKRCGPPTFKYRGWFINDEDLLSGFAADPLRENTFSLEMWERICETLLRLRGNLLVPGTFTFPDERAQELAARRGLALNMHHILPVGLNTYRWPPAVPFSFSRHPEVMERYWQACIDAFKDKEVVWTVGYRGKHDRPFWVDEPGMDTPAARGAAISQAIARQVELVRKAQPGAPIITNLWAEGAALMRQGFLKIPAGVTIVWSDDGRGLIQDQGGVQAGQGIYYHTAMLNNSANQLSELVSPGRIYNEVGRFARAGATEFFLVNVSDVRPVPLSTDCAMRLVWDAKPCLGRTDVENMNDFTQDWCRRQYGPAVAARAARLYLQYYDIPYQRRATRQGENVVNTRLLRLAQATSVSLASGAPLGAKALQSVMNELKFTSSGLAYVKALNARAEALTAQIPPARRDFYKGHLLTQTRIHLHLLEMLQGCAGALAAYADGDRPRAQARAGEALAASDALFAALHEAEYGKWAGWYRGEGFVGLEASRDQLRTLAALLRGEAPPPLRARRGYEHLYQYQEPFAKNFPLLYEKRQEK